MKSTVAITAVESKAGFPEMLLEKFVQDNLPAGSRNLNRTSGPYGLTEEFQEIEICAAETPVYGNIEISFKIKNHAGGCIIIEVSTIFFVTCTRKNYDNYKVAWVCSLS